jgi:predicted transposase YdaD
MAFGLPGAAEIAEVGQSIKNFVTFGHTALTTIVQNQHSIHARLVAIESKLNLPDQPPLRGLPNGTGNTIDGN